MKLRIFKGDCILVINSKGKKIMYIALNSNQILASNIGLNKVAIRNLNIKEGEKVNI
jgi:hypothetical protein